MAHQPAPDRNQALREQILREQILALAHRHRRYGAGMIYLKLRQAGQRVNHKRVDHRLSPPRNPQTRGMVKRFNGRIAEVIEHTHFGSTAEWVDTLERYVEIDNQHIPQRALQHQTPFQAIEAWRAKSPESFVD